MTYRISDLEALGDPRLPDRPTLQVTVRLQDGTSATVGVPAGASTGSRGAVERRDGEASR
jgi:enolase